MIWKLFRIWNMQHLAGEVKRSVTRGTIYGIFLPPRAKAASVLGATWRHVIIALPTHRYKRQRAVMYTENFNIWGFHDSSMWYKPHQRYTGTLLSGYSELYREKSKDIHDFAPWSYSSWERNVSIWCYSILQIRHLPSAKIISSYSRFSVKWIQLLNIPVQSQ